MNPQDESKTPPSLDVVHFVGLGWIVTRRDFYTADPYRLAGPFETRREAVTYAKGLVT